MSRSDLRVALAESLGTLLLAATVIGSGTLAARLTDEPATQLLLGAIATAGMLGAIIAALQVAGAGSFNPVVSIADVAFGTRKPAWLALVLPAQLAGALAGAMLARSVHGLAPFAVATTERATPATLTSEAVATAGLCLVVFVLARAGRASLIAPALGAYVLAAALFTSSGAVANPALTLARMLGDEATGIAPATALGYLLAQAVGGAIGCLVARVLVPVPASTGTSRHESQ